MTGRIETSTNKEINKHLFKALLLAAMVFLVITTPAFAAPPTFGPPGSYPVEQTPIDVTSADFDGDGDIDLATANRFGGGNDDVTVFKNNGDGTYDTGTDFLGGVSTFSIETGDFNNDKKPDIVLTDPDSSPNSIVVLLNEGGGGTLGFGEPQTTDLSGSFPTDVAVGDFDGDGNNDDLAVADAGSNEVEILISNSGTFTSGDKLTTGFSSPQGVDAGDFDGKGDKDDLAIANAGGNDVIIYLGDGNGNFTQSDTVQVGTEPGQVNIADFDGNSKQDFAASNYSDDTVSVALGNGNGTFQAPQAFSTGNGPYDLVADDYDRDGKLDIAVENYKSDNVSVLTGNGEGTFQTTGPLAVGQGPFGITTGSFDKGEGKGGPDLATANFTSGDVSVLLNTTPQADLALTKKAAFSPGSEPTVGQNITYTLKVKNNGPDSAANVLIRDTLPSGVEFVSADAGCKNESGTVTCKVGTLANGASATRKILVRVTNEGDLTNTAETTSVASDPTTPNTDEDIRNATPKGSSCTITGTDGNDALRGTRGPDVICGLGGNDVIDGRGGDDVIFGGPGDDVMKGGGGQDNVFGEDGTDTIDTRDSVRDEYVDGGTGSDICRTDAGDKRVSCP